MGIKTDTTPRPEDYINREFTKLFRPDRPYRKNKQLIPFTGTITHYNQQTKLYRAIYTDNDCEDLELHEVTQLNFNQPLPHFFF